jgi:hypothetical protein
VRERITSTSQLIILLVPIYVAASLFQDLQLHAPVFVELAVPKAGQLCQDVEPQMELWAENKLSKIVRLTIYIQTRVKQLQS